MKKLLLGVSLSLLLVLPALAQVSGALPFLANGLSTTVKTVKGSNGKLQWFRCINPNTAVAYVQVFDTSGTVTLGTTAPKLILPLASSSADGGPVGVSFLSGIKIAATTTATGSTAPTTALDCAFGFN